ncbi:MAG: hypothetical protein NUV67_05910 [archaeon]|nr:hypothetical protein [archaeon]
MALGEFVRNILLEVNTTLLSFSASFYISFNSILTNPNSPLLWRGILFAFVLIVSNILFREALKKITNHGGYRWGQVAANLLLYLILLVFTISTLSAFTGIQIPLE